jgi:hypothetical protein
VRRQKFNAGGVNDDDDARRASRICGSLIIITRLRAS